MTQSKSNDNAARWDMIWNCCNQSKTLKAIAGGIGLLIIAAPLLHSFFAGEPAMDASLTGSFATRRGEHRCLKLPEGSEACLNTNSQINYTFNRNTRNIELVSGEASFVVRNDRRPFDVVSGSVLIHDLSTSFEVYQKRHSTQVTVLRGRVKVIAPINDETRGKFDLAEAESAWKRGLEIHELQQVEFDETGRALHVRPPLNEQRLAQLLEWQKGRIDLNGRTMGEALDEFSRYQPISQFTYADPSIRTIRVGGNLEFAHLDDFLAAIEHEFHVRHTIAGRDASAVVLLSRERAH
jgi:transmembrane sensor